ncbi:MAG: hypothetical protein GYB64_13545 [Chloroflexi bacterium]|nr:hypothetical protein [Chloroflexota bacterium]
MILRPLNMPPYFGVSIRATTGKVWTSAPDDLIAITGEWGYSATPPEVIEQAATRLAAWLYRQRDTGTDAPTLEVDERGVIAAPPRLPWDILQMLTPYTRIRVKAGAA